MNEKTQIRKNLIAVGENIHSFAGSRGSSISFIAVVEETYQFIHGLGRLSEIAYLYLTLYDEAARFEKLLWRNKLFINNFIDFAQFLF